MDTEKLKGPNVHEKEDEYNSKMVYPVLMVKIIFVVLTIAGAGLFYVLEIKGML